MTSLLRTLVVDDAAPIALLHTRFVDAHPACTVVGTAGTGPEAVDAILALAPDLVLLDVHLPGHSGLDALRKVRADAAIVQPEVIAVTAARDIEHVREARLLGVRHYIVKPFSAADLHARIDDVVRERATDPDPRALDQGAVDAAMQGRVTASPAPKGMSRETLDLVRTALVTRGSASAAEIADDVGLSRVSCRRYLEHLADTGEANRSLDYGTAGRPSTRYRMV